MGMPLSTLIVEDKADDAELMAHELRRVGFELSWKRVETEPEFLADLDAGYDIILSDYNLPQFNAARALELLKRCELDIPFIVVTGSISEGAAVEMMKRGAADYLLKDRLTRLGPAVEAAMEQKRLRQQQRQAAESLRQFAETQRMLLRELDHRVRNNLSSLLGLIQISAQSAGSVAEFAETISGRVRTMAGVHSLLSQSQWGALELRRLIYAIAPTEACNRIALEGPAVEIPTRQVTAMGFVVHELLTNSLKHGALKSPRGAVKIAWERERDDQSRGTLEMRWQERDGPQIQKPPTHGAGMSIVKGLVEYELRGSVNFNFPQTGAEHELRVRLDQTVAVGREP